MAEKGELLILMMALFTFAILVVASNEIAKIFQKVKLPLITGFILIGVIVGPYVLDMLPAEAIPKLNFINDVALAFIAFAAGSEMFLKELDGKLRNIWVMTLSQFFITFGVSFIALMALSEYIPFMSGHNQSYQIAIAILISTIFIARSPASAIAIINELRAKGPFTKVALGVTIIKDILVILLFTVTFSIASSLIAGTSIEWSAFLKVMVELVVSIFIGWLYAKILEVVFSLKINFTVETILFIFIGWSIFLLSHFIDHYVGHHYHIQLHLEPLLSGIVASFYITNYSKYRLHMQRIIETASPYVYVAFFTLIGASLSLDVLFKYWKIAIVLFAIRLGAIIIASIIGSILNKDNLRNTLLSWTPYITQAGVSLGLITIVAHFFPQFGSEFETILIAVIIINQFVGPPLMKWAIIWAGEAHNKAEHSFDGIRDVMIFGYENQALALGRSLQKHNWHVKIITEEDHPCEEECHLEIIKIDEINADNLRKIDTDSADAAILLKTDDQNLKITKLLYEEFGTPIIVVRLNDVSMYPKFKEYNTLVVEPSTAVVSLMEHFVVSPYATSILLGWEEGQTTMDIEVLNRDIHGKQLRDIRLPLGVLVLSIVRNGQVIVSHGYTRIRLHDIVTVLGSPEQLEQVRMKLQY